MPTSSQEPRGPGLSSSLVTDFRAILSSLEQEKAVQPGAPEPRERPAAAVPLPSRASADAANPAAASTPRPYGEVRERIAALGDVGDLLNRRSVGAPGTGARPATGAGAAADSQPRRRSFGAAARASGEAEGRRKRNSSKDIITWQRLGALAIFIAVVGGGAVLLQSLAAREEAKVADEVIGNAAVASVAPSVPVPAAAAPAQPTAVQTAQLQQAAPTHSAPSSVTPSPDSLADNLPPLLRDTASPFDASAPVAVTAFAAPATAARSVVAPAAVEPEPVAVPAVVPESVAAPAVVATPAPKPVALPKEAPLPPARPAVASAEAAPARAAAEPETADEAEAQSGFGGDPVGTATIRSSVTMRVAPKRGSAAVGNLSAGQKVELVACHGWCEVIAEGKRGFIYKSFVNAGTSARVETEAEADAATQ
ncbi:SH3 domain-containing protein [Ancylobacter sp. TS-1]|uniref:SH3 domain-containing protein n=1 Tax=Ancylobacter sp. TS-1 TaxID=1850374 RepID=UPI001265CA49|nr:SH3 domain-containing protein [Ancylobacter sp. TS-1]QFR32754.1 SH3 domain-containing protein [Ancylobacter sp. TS-1]